MYNHSPTLECVYAWNIALYNLSYIFKRYNIIFGTFVYSFSYISTDIYVLRSYSFSSLRATFALSGERLSKMKKKIGPILLVNPVKHD